MQVIKCIMLAAMAAALLGSGCSQKEPSPSQSPSQGAIQNTNQAARTVQYTCPMHPDVVQDKPGTCPKCGMTLVEKK